MENYIIAFVGLPSSGKSSLINSLLGKRKLESGICRTTTEAQLIADEIIDDDNNKFNVIDLPGMCDSEEKDNNFNKLTYEYITKAHLIFWCSDVRNAFLTSHEVSEFNKLKEYLIQKIYDNNKLYELDIILTKCSERFDNNSESSITISAEALDDEIKEEVENTSVCDIYTKIKEKFSEHNIILFNAFGRSYHHKNSSKTLKTFVKKIVGVPSKENINFSITNYISNYKSKNMQLIETIFYKKMDEYILENSIQFEEFIDLFDLCKNKENILASIYAKTARAVCNITECTYSCYDKKLVKTFVYLYKNICFKQTYLRDLYYEYRDLYYDILFDIINNNTYTLNLIKEYTIRDIYRELNDDKYFYCEINFIDILTKKLEKQGLYEFLNYKYSFSESTTDKNYNFVKKILYYCILHFSDKESVNHSIIKKLKIWCELNEHVKELIESDIRSIIGNLMIKQGNHMILNKINFMINNKYYILYNKIAVYLVILNEYCANTNTQYINQNNTYVNEKDENEILVASFKDKQNIHISKLYTLINKMSECVSINNNTQKKHLQFDHIAHFLDRLCALKEFKNIFRKCLLLIYSNCGDELDDILDIKPYYMLDVIEINK